MASAFLLRASVNRFGPDCAALAHEPSNQRPFVGIPAVVLEFWLMGRAFGSRTLLLTCCMLTVLLAALAVVQYRWSARVAAADVQREEEYLNSAAALFATRFNEIVGETAGFLQNEAKAAVEAGRDLPPIPPLIDEVYYLHLPEKGAKEVMHLAEGGRFSPSPLPEWLSLPHCAPIAYERPLAMVVPIYDINTLEDRGPQGIRVLKTLRRQPERCFAATIDQTNLRDRLLPDLIRQTFGQTASEEYDFAVVSRGQARGTLYGPPVRADLKKMFFSMMPNLIPRDVSSAGTGEPRPPTMFFQRVETVVNNGPGRMLGLFGPGIWELQVAHKGQPLTVAFENRRKRDLMLSLAVEVLLLAAIAFLVIGTQRMQRLADQKMRFVAGVSHELRTPVSAIAMLSRNQADGLVSGGDKVRQYGELIHQQSRRLNEMVEQTLQYAGIHSGLRRPAKAQVDLHRLIEELLETRRAELTQSGFQVETDFCPDLPPVLGDENLLRTAFDNLLSNALKYAGEGHWIRVTAGHFPQEKEIRISVEDRGAGIDPADQAEIFEPFYRGRAAIEAQIPGSGLGLSLVRTAAEVHRGTVTLSSQPGRGSVFTMHLPL